MYEKIKPHLKNLSNISNNFAVETISFNTNQLPPINNFNTDIRQNSSFTKMFELLNTKKGFCIYWFECENEDLATELVTIFKDELQNLSAAERTIPPFSIYSNSKVLYVGVRQGGYRKYDGLTNIAGRIIQHLGYYDKGSTGAIHLAHWAMDKSFEVTLNVIELELLEKEYLYIIEKLFALSLKPLFGKH